MFDMRMTYQAGEFDIGTTYRADNDANVVDTQDQEIKDIPARFKILFAQNKYSQRGFERKYCQKYELHQCKSAV